MVIGGTVENIGENIEFSVGDAGTEVTIYFNGEDETKTSDDDTATEKYTDAYVTVKKFHLRNNQAITILSMNGLEFTNPISVPKNAGHKEVFDAPVVFKMVIKTSTASTGIKLRIKGRGRIA